MRLAGEHHTTLSFCIRKTVRKLAPLVEERRRVRDGGSQHRRSCPELPLFTNRERELVYASTEGDLRQIAHCPVASSHQALGESILSCERDSLTEYSSISAPNRYKKLSIVSRATVALLMTGHVMTGLSASK